jgi:hypothetical protein
MLGNEVIVGDELHHGGGGGTFRRFRGRMRKVGGNQNQSATHSKTNQSHTGHPKRTLFKVPRNQSGFEPRSCREVYVGVHIKG